MVKAAFKTFVVTLSLLLISISYSVADSKAKSNELVFGILSTGKNTYTTAQWKLLLDQVSLNAGQKIRFEAVDNAEDFERNLSRGAYDFVLLNAHMYTQVHDAIGYRAFAKEQGQKDKGVIVVHRDSSIKTLADLNSQTLALSDPRRYSSTVLTRANLNRKGIDVNEEFVETDNSVYRAVAHGTYAAGAGEMNSLNGINPNSHAKLRVIWSSKQYSSNAFAVHPRVKEDQLARFQKALLNLGNDDKGKRLLSNVKFKGITAAADQEWDDVRALKRHLSQ
ncbi:MAG: phosphate/phosphite/phosphonate ABC transporter substrate-binding protein [Gammaproteobacteria bacterium]|jgi:phosphonate transport system substrate-binding protein